MGRRKISPQLLVLEGFWAIIMVGTILLSLPISSKQAPISFIDALFVSTSAVCVTGLTPIHIANTLSTFGTTVVMLLFQIGGLGFAVLAVSILSMYSGKIEVSSGNILRDSLGADPKDPIKKILKVTLLSTLLFETVGAVILSLEFAKDIPLGEAIYKGIFTSISAFNNAGFDLFDNSLTGYDSNSVVLITVAVLIILGGLGFIFYLELIEHKKHKSIPLHVKIVSVTTLSLLVFGTLVFRYSSGLDWLNAFFQSATTRTAGFTSIDQSALNSTGYIVTLALMFIGASPGSTGGGIKTTTIYTAVKASFALLTGRQPVSFNRQISDSSVMKAFFVLIISLIVILLSVLLISITEETLSLESIVYEAISAYATVGLSMGITPLISSSGKLIIIMLMFFGRVGILSIISLFMRRTLDVKHIEGKVVIG